MYFNFNFKFDISLKFHYVPFHIITQNMFLKFL